MDEYIKRKAVTTRIKEYASDVYGIDLDNSLQFAGITGNGVDENICEGLHEATEVVNDIPAADVAPVVHGRWEETDWIELEDGGNELIKTPNAALRCSNCRNCFKKKLLWKDAFCPNCGAKMDGGTTDEL